MRKILFSSACVLLLLTAMGVRAEEPVDEPVYQGHTVADWIKALDADDAAARALAIHVLGIFGPDAKPAIPALLKALEESEIEVRYRAVIALGRIGLEGDKVAPALARKLTDTTYEIAKEAAEAMDRFGKPAVPPLIEALKEPRARYLVLTALRKIGPDAKEALPVLKELLNQKDRVTQKDNCIAAVRAIQAIDPKDESGLPVLLELLEDKKYRPTTLVEALAHFGPQAKKAVPALLEIMKTPDKFDSGGFHNDPLKSAAAHALGKIAPDDGELFDAMIELRKVARAMYLANEVLVHMPRFADRLLPDAESGPVIVRPRRGGQDTSTLLYTMGRDAVPALLAVAKDAEKSAGERAKAILFLGNIGQRTDLTAPVLIKLLRDKDKEVQKQAGIALARMGAEAKSAIPILQEWLKSDADLRGIAINAISAIDIDTPGLLPLYLDRLIGADRLGRVPYGLVAVKLDKPKYVPNLVAAWVKASPTSRPELAKILGQIGPAAKDAAPVLREAMKEKDLNLKMACAIALLRIDPAARDAVEMINDLLDDSPTRRLMANPVQTMRLLDELGPLAEPAVPALVKHIGSVGRRGWYYDAYRTLRKIGPAARAAAPALIKALADAKDGGEGREIIETLAAIGPDGDGVMETLIASLDSPNGYIANSALVALGKMGAEAKQISPKLLELLAAERPIPILPRPTPHPGTGFLPSAQPRPRLPRKPIWKGTAEQAKVLNAVDVAVVYWKLEHKAGPVVPVLCMALETSTLAPRTGTTGFEDVYAVLAEIGPRAQAAAPALHGVLNHANVEGRDRSAYVLWRIEGKTERMLPILIHALFEQDRRSFAGLNTAGPRAAELLGKMGVDAKPALPALLEAYHTTNPALRKAAGEAIKAIDPDAAKKAVIP
jgi:HEAT repeat protein